jgi:hypothetical protein
MPRYWDLVLVPKNSTIAQYLTSRSCGFFRCEDRLNLTDIAHHKGKGGFLPVVPIDTKGGMQTFAAGANWIGQLERSGRSERRSNFSDVQAQRMAATSPESPMLRRAPMSGLGKVLKVLETIPWVFIRCALSH